jgi:SAM-dependent methyltransferase
MMMKHSPADPYERIAELYDLEHDAHDDDIDFYLNFVQVVGDPVLELGCGTGRLLAPIAESGYRIVGVDQSAAMLERAAEATKRYSGLVSLHQGGMTDLSQVPGGPFGTIVIGLNGLLHLASAAEQRACLSAVKAALDPRGQVLIDVFNPTPETLRNLDQSLMLEGTWTKPDGTRVDKFGSRRVLPASQTIATEIWYDLTGIDGTVKRIATSFAMRYLSPSELELMLELAGFPEWQIYGSYDLDPLGDHSERILIAAEASPS